MTAPRHDLLGTLPEAIATRVRAILPDLAECRGMRGRFDLDTLKRDGIKAPAVLVSMLGLRQAQTYAGPMFTFQASFAAFVVTKDRLGLSRDDAAAAIVTALLKLTPDNRWGEAHLLPAAEVEAEAIVTPDLDRAGVSLWAVGWRQNLTLDTYAVPGPLPITLYLGQAPEIGPGNEADYVRVGQPG